MRTMWLTIAFAAVLLLGLSIPAMADPGSTASCVGIGSSWAGQRQFRDNVAHNTKEFSASLGLVPGDLVHETAQDHAGSFFACFGFNP